MFDGTINYALSTETFEKKFINLPHLCKILTFSSFDILCCQHDIIQTHYELFKCVCINFSFVRCDLTFI